MYKRAGGVKSKAKGLRHIKADPILKFDSIFIMYLCALPLKKIESCRKLCFSNLYIFATQFRLDISNYEY